MKKKKKKNRRYAGSTRLREGKRYGWSGGMSFGGELTSARAAAKGLLGQMLLELEDMGLVVLPREIVEKLIKVFNAEREVQIALGRVGDAMEDLRDDA